MYLFFLLPYILESQNKKYYNFYKKYSSTTLPKNSISPFLWWSSSRLLFRFRRGVVMLEGINHSIPTYRVMKLHVAPNVPERAETYLTLGGYLSEGVSPPRLFLPSPKNSDRTRSFRRHLKEENSSKRIPIKKAERGESINLSTIGQNLCSDLTSQKWRAFESYFGFKVLEVIGSGTGWAILV